MPISRRRARSGGWTRRLRHPPGRCGGASPPRGGALGACRRGVGGQARAGHAPRGRRARPRRESAPAFPPPPARSSGDPRPSVGTAAALPGQQRGRPGPVDCRKPLAPRAEVGRADAHDDPPDRPPAAEARKPGPLVHLQVVLHLAVALRAPCSRRSSCRGARRPRRAHPAASGRAGARRRGGAWPPSAADADARARAPRPRRCCRRRPGRPGPGAAASGRPRRRAHALAEAGEGEARSEAARGRAGRRRPRTPVHPLPADAARRIPPVEPHARELPHVAQPQLAPVVQVDQQVDVSVSRSCGGHHEELTRHHHLDRQHRAPPSRVEQSTSPVAGVGGRGARPRTPSGSGVRDDVRGHFSGPRRSRATGARGGRRSRATVSTSGKLGHGSSVLDERTRGGTRGPEAAPARCAGVPCRHGRAPGRRPPRRATPPGSGPRPAPSAHERVAGPGRRTAPVRRRPATVAMPGQPDDPRRHRWSGTSTTDGSGPRRPTARSGTSADPDARGSPAAWTVPLSSERKTQPRLARRGAAGSASDQSRWCGRPRNPIRRLVGR